METGNGRILCVDDSLDTCLMMAALLGAGGYTVKYALSALDGLNLAKSSVFDLILLDWTLTDGTGVDLCRTIRGFDPNTPIVFLSGRSSASDHSQATDVGAQGFLMKPCSMDDLLKVVSRLVVKGTDNHGPV
jgi:two-component system, OmpR family, manganese sensing response regulator